MSAGVFFRQSPGFEEAYRLGLVASIFGSEHFGPSALGKEFVSTTGLSLVFKRDYIGAITSHFPAMDRLFEVALFESSNAFYVNPLVLDDSSTVEEHVDCRYIPDTDARILPTLVSIYYAEIDGEMQGGELVLVTDDGLLVMKPECNEIVHFVGHMRHYVSKIRNPCRRVSIVIEQYNLETDNLAAFPDCHVVRNDLDILAPVRR